MHTVVARTHNYCQILTGGNIYMVSHPFKIFTSVHSFLSFVSVFRSCSSFLVNIRFLILSKLPVRAKAYMA